MLTYKVVDEGEKGLTCVDVEVYFQNIKVATITISDQFMDYTDMDNKRYNLLTVESGGAVLNSKPIED